MSNVLVLPVAAQQALKQSSMKIDLKEITFRSELDLCIERSQELVKSLKALDSHAHHDDGDQEEINEQLNRALDVHTTLVMRRNRDRSA